MDVLINYREIWAVIERRSEKSPKKESLKKESLKKESLKKESLKKESLKNENHKKTVPVIGSFESFSELFLRNVETFLKYLLSWLQITSQRTFSIIPKAFSISFIEAA
jgi:hypothetical protein